MAEVKIPVSAELNTADIETSLRTFTDQMNALIRVINQANKTKFDPINKSTIEDLKKVTAQFENLKKISPALNRRLRDTGQSSSNLFDVDWARMYEDPRMRMRQMDKYVRYVTSGTSFEGAIPAPPTPTTQPTPNPQNPPANPAQPGPGGILRRITGAGLRSAGPAGGVADEALTAGMSGGIVAGLAGLAGGLAALGIGKVVSGIASKVGDAQKEMIGYDTLKRTLGDVNVSFNLLKDSIRSASESFDVTYAEGQKLATEFAKVSGISREQYKTLAEQVQLSGGFARSFGLDPSQSNAFFAQMQQFRVSGNVDQNRNLALMIGEAVAKSGAFTKADEILQAVASFTAQQTRMGLVAANTVDYTSMLTGLIASHTPGLDPAGSAALLSRVNSAISNGGNAGEAGQNFMYQALGNNLGLNPIQTKILEEQGAFGRGSETFGPGSLYYKFALQNGLQLPSKAAQSNETNIEALMKRLHEVYKDQPYIRLSAMANLFGLNTNQAMALDTIKPDQLGGVANRLAKNHIDLNKVNPTGIERLSSIEADKTLTDAQKDDLFKKTATQNQEATEGDKTRHSIVGVQNELQKLASLVVPPLNSMRDSMLYLAGAGKMGPGAIAEAVRKLEFKDKAESIEETKQQLIQKNQQLREYRNKQLGLGSKAYQDAFLGPRDPEKQKKYTEERNKIDQQIKENETQIKSLDNQSLLNDAAQKENLTPEMASLAGSIYAQESSSGKNTKTSNAGAVGGMQMTPATFKRFADPGWDINNPSQNMRAAMRYLKFLNERAHGDLRATAAGYYGGEGVIGKDGNIIDRRDPRNPSAPSTREYADQVVGRIGGQYTPMSDNQAISPYRNSDGSPITIRTEHQIQLTDMNNKPVAAPVVITKEVQTPSPFGAK